MPGSISPQYTALKETLKELRDVNEDMNRLNTASKEEIWMGVTGTVHIVDVLRKLIDDSTINKRLTNLVVGKRNRKNWVNGRERDKMCASVQFIKGLTELTRTKFPIKDHEGLSHIERDMIELFNNLSAQDSPYVVERTKLGIAANGTAKLAQTIMKTIEEHLEDEWYQTQVIEADRINDCDSADYARILGLETPSDNTEEARDAYERLSSLLSPCERRANQYYEGALSAFFRKF